MDQTSFRTAIVLARVSDIDKVKRLKGWEAGECEGERGKIKRLYQELKFAFDMWSPIYYVS